MVGNVARFCALALFAFAAHASDDEAFIEVVVQQRTITLRLDRPVSAAVSMGLVGHSEPLKFDRIADRVLRAELPEALGDGVHRLRVRGITGASFADIPFTIGVVGPFIDEDR
jgi:hypothetical protein